MINLDPTFTELDHRYTDDAGNVYPSTTTIIDEWWPVDKKWFAKNPGAATRGTEIHAMTAMMDRMRLSSEDAAVMNPDYVMYLKAWSAFSQTHVDQYLWIEQRFIAEILGYAGTVDRIAQMSTGELAVIDIKTGAKQPYHELQLGAYGVAAKLAGINVEAAATVHPTVSGNYSIVEYDLPRAMTAWKALMQWVNYRGSMK